jgi:MscS family membrane protein
MTLRCSSWLALTAVISGGLLVSQQAAAQKADGKVPAADSSLEKPDGAVADGKTGGQPDAKAPAKKLAPSPKSDKHDIDPRLLSATGKKRIKLKVEKKLNAGLGKAPAGLDRSTPNKSWSAYLRNCQANRWEQAAHVFNLGDVPIKDQKVLGLSAARKLCEVLSVTGQLSASGLDDTTVGPMINESPTNYLVVAKFDQRGKVEEAWLRATQDKSTGKTHWVLTRRTLSNVASWHRRLVRKEQGREAVAVINLGLGRIPAKFDLHSPRAAAKTFAKLSKDGDYELAARLLDLSSIDKKLQKRRGRKLARRLALVLRRLKPGFAATLSNDPRGAPEKGVPGDEEQILSLTIEGAELAVRLALYPRRDGSEVWLFSQATVAAINKLYDHHGSGWAGDYLPPLFFTVEFWGVQLWQWIGLLIGLVLAYIFGHLAAFFSRKALLRAVRLTDWAWDDQLVLATRGPMRMILAALGFVIVVGLLALNKKAQLVAFGGVKLVAIISVGWFIARALDVAGQAGLEYFRERDDELGMAMVPVARRIFKPIVWVLIAIVALQNVGINVAGLIAGLGIGGLALAMASKTTVENMLGGITIAFDRPFKVGDFIKVGDILGSVEEVGLRSTRIRTLDRTVVTVPNGQMADAKVENFAPRDKIRLTFKIGVQYDSSLEQVRYIIDELKRAVLEHSQMVHEGFRVRFIGFSDSSLDIEVYSFVDTTDYNVFTAVREELYLRIGEIVATAGAQFAYPTRTIYQGKASAADGEKAKQAADLIAQRSEAGELTIPEVPEELRIKLTGKPSASGS